MRSTHAHSWARLFDTEREAFQEYAQALPNNCVFLVDTYGTLDERLLNPHLHPVGLEPGLQELRTRMILEALSMKLIMVAAAALNITPLDWEGNARAETLPAMRQLP